MRISSAANGNYTKGKVKYSKKKERKKRDYDVI